MPHQNNPLPPNVGATELYMLLGEINANVKNLQTDVSDVKIELQGFGSRVTALETWKAAVEGQARGGFSVGKLLMGVIVGLCAFILGNIVEVDFEHDASPKAETVAR